MNPRVSIIIPCYNQGHFLEETIQSCLSQTYDNIEVIVVDDGSTDNTAELCQRYISEITYIHQKNGGLPYARNVGILASSGEYLQFLDSDDLIFPEKIKSQVAEFQAHPELGAVYSQGVLIDEKSAVFGKALVNHPSGWVYHELLTMWGTLVPAILVRKQCLARVGLFSTDLSIKGCEDADMWLRIALKYQFASLPDEHFAYRSWQGSMSSNWPMMLRSGLEVVRRNSHGHPKCRDCRRYSRAGIKRWKTVASFAMMEDARESFKHGNGKQAVENLLFVLRNNPVHVKQLVSPRYLSQKFNHLIKPFR